MHIYIYKYVLYILPYIYIRFEKNHISHISHKNKRILQGVRFFYFKCTKFTYMNVNIIPTNRVLGSAKIDR